MTQEQENNAEEIEVEVEAEAPHPDIEVDVEEPEESVDKTIEAAEPEGDGRVEINDPKVQKRFNEIYKQVKMSDKRNQMLMTFLEEQQKQLDSLKQNSEQVNQSDAVKQLTSRLKEAREAGDDDTADKVLQELIDFRVKSEIEKAKPKEEKAKPLYIDPDVEAVVAFAKETDSNGNMLRPWISQDHPKHAQAMKLASIYAMEVNAEYGDVDVPEVMKRVDEAMKTKPKLQANTNTRQPDPMRGNLTNRPVKGKIKLTAQEMSIAQKLGISAKDYAANKV